MRNEHLCLRRLTAVLGPDEVTAFSLDRVTGLDETALIVTRFDRTPAGAKLRAEDFTQILSKPAGADHAGKYDADYADVAAVIRAHSARPEIDLARFFKRLVAFVLVANGDAHLKNFTLLERPEGLRLSPTCDVVNVGIYAGEGSSQRLALALGGAPISLDAVDRAARSGCRGRPSPAPSATSGPRPERPASCCRTRTPGATRSGRALPRL